MQDLASIPEARVTPHRRWSLQLVWLIPIIATLIGGWLAVKAVLDRGPTITISFSTAEGLEPEKTRVKYRSVDIGRVTAITFSEDRTRVVATVALNKQAKPFLVADTRFWVVRPRVSGAQISGLGTLLSGAYIGMDAGASSDSRREFVGLDVPPIVTVDLPGRHFQLRADDLGSLDVGSPVYFRRVQVGSVVAFELDKDGAGVQLRVFINAPHDRHVKADTRFWHASGFDVALDASGIRLNTESVASMLLGGVAFQTPAESVQAPPAEGNASFTLYPDQGKALRLPDTAEETYHLVFDESVRGLSVGAPVDFRGVVVGEVTAIEIDFDPKSMDVRIPVEVRLYPDRLRGKAKQGAAPRSALIDKLVSHGLRAQLRSGSLLTGQLVVALDYFPDEPKAAVLKRAGRSEIPTVASSLQELQATLLRLARKLDKLPLAATVGDARKSLKALESMLITTESTMKRVDKDLTPQAARTLADLSRTLAHVERGLDGLVGEDAPIQRDVRETLREVSRAAEALRSLSDYLERNPGAILRGRVEEPAQ
ncbi:MAG: MlaD family protein [Sulfurimicrobium sp.]|nr:MlaD family protein [Sulfurimicrobium sp.]MDP1703583.1 MlaD family protein [Sulfurimicrobium sp.]MDP2197762.1 MlaD family protein [Sulfurimicrobium sp.]MDP3686315.1 MlaD family protein [Sulfurimicrobium sp.]